MDCLGCLKFGPVPVRCVQCPAGINQFIGDQIAMRNAAPGFKSKLKVTRCPPDSKKWPGSRKESDGFLLIWTLHICKGFLLICTVHICESFLLICTLHICKGFLLIWTLHICKGFLLIWTLHICKGFLLIWTLHICEGFLFIWTLHICKGFLLIYIIVPYISVKVSY